MWFSTGPTRVFVASVGSLGYLAAAASLISGVPTPAHLGASTSRMSVSIVSPAWGSTVSGELHVTGQVRDAGSGTSVLLEIDGTSAQVVPSRAAWGATVDTKVFSNGPLHLTAVAVDGPGLTARASTVVTVANLGKGPSAHPRPSVSPRPVASPGGGVQPSPTVATPSPTSQPTLEPTPTPATGGSGFVRASGTQLTLNGAPYRFEGLNVYNVASNGGCVPYLNPNTALQQIGSGQNVFRFWAFQQFAVDNGAFNWAPFQNVLNAAAAHGERVIMDLTDEWSYCDGGAKALSWYQTGYKDTVFPGDIVPYRQYVADVVAHFANNPTILMWELVNEAQAGGSGACAAEPAPFDALMSFGNDMASLVKSIDPNNLLSFGVQDNSCGTWGADYQQLNAISGIDVCTYHDYGYPNDPLGNPTAPDLATAIQMCHADNKPIFVGEMGIDPSTISPSTLQERANLFQAKFNAMTQAGVVGELLWDFTPVDQGSYEIGPGDPALSILGSY